jgi:hypothetical protein
MGLCLFFNNPFFGVKNNVDFPKNVTSGMFDKIDIAANAFGLLICVIVAMNQGTNRQT